MRIKQAFKPFMPVSPIGNRSGLSRMHSLILSYIVNIILPSLFSRKYIQFKIIYQRFVNYRKILV